MLRKPATKEPGLHCKRRGEVSDPGLCCKRGRGPQLLRNTRCLPRCAVVSLGLCCKTPWLSPQLLMNVPMLATQCGGRSLDVLEQPVPHQGSVRCSRKQITPDWPCASYGSKKKQSQSYDYDMSQQALHVSDSQFDLRENTCLRKDLRHATQLMTCRSYSTC